MGNGLNVLESIIKEKNSSCQNWAIEQNEIIKILEDTLAILNPVKAFEVMNNVYFELIDKLKKENTKNLQNFHQKYQFIRMIKNTMLKVL